MADRLHDRSVCRRFPFVWLLAALYLPVWSFAQTVQSEKQPAVPTPLASTLEHTPPHLPSVTFRNGELTIVAYNATLRDILEMVRTQTGAVIDVPPEANERVIVCLGPGPARRVLDSLLAGSDFNFIMLGSADDAEALTRVVLSAKPHSDAEKGNLQKAAQAVPDRPESATVRRQEPPPERIHPIQQVEDSAPVKEPAANIAAKQEDADKGANAKLESQDKTETAAVPGNQSPADYPRTPNIKTAQEVLQDLYARRRQTMEQQQQQHAPP